MISHLIERGLILHPSACILFTQIRSQLFLTSFHSSSEISYSCPHEGNIQQAQSHYDIFRQRCVKMNDRTYNKWFSWNWIKLVHCPKIEEFQSRNPYKDEKLSIDTSIEKVKSKVKQKCGVEYRDISNPIPFFGLFGLAGFRLKINIHQFSVSSPFQLRTCRLSSWWKNSSWCLWRNESWKT